MKRNLTVKEREIVKRTMPRLNTANWLLIKKLPTTYVIKHKETGRKKNVPVALERKVE